LQVNVSKRLTISQVCDHKWFSRLSKAAATAQQVPLDMAQQELHLFNAKRKLRASIKLAIAANRMADVALKVQSLTGMHPGKGGKTVTE